MSKKTIITAIAKPKQQKNTVKIFKAKNPYAAKNLKKDAVPDTLVDKQGKFILWGNTNDFPISIIETIRRSTTAKACSTTLARYIYGNGFNDKTVAKYFDSSLFKVSGQLTNLNGFAFFVKFNGAMEMVSCEPMDFENIRLGLSSVTKDEQGNEVNTGNIEYVVYNPNFGSYNYKSTENKIYPLYEFDKSHIIPRLEKYGNEGFVIWVGLESEYARFYPLPTFWGDSKSEGGGYDAMLADYLLGRLLTKELGSGFLQNVILKMVGDENAPLTEADGNALDQGKDYKTVGDAFQKYLDETFQGIDGDAMMVLWSKTKEQFPELQAFPSTFNYEKLNNVVDTVRTQVATAWNVPLILANIATSGSLSKDDIESAVNLMHGVVRPYQMILQRTFQKIVNEMSLQKPELVGLTANIENYNPFPQSKTVDEKAWEVMTLEEKRNWVEKNTDVELLTPTQDGGIISN